eukprot:1335717-Rhodomonas_salina.1
MSGTGLAKGRMGLCGTRVVSTYAVCCTGAYQPTRCASETGTERARLVVPGNGEPSEWERRGAEAGGGFAGGADEYQRSLRK